jgi:crossover junction endodeoxyribonuclease RusA
MTWRIELPYSMPPLSLNQRMHWARKAKLTQQVRDDTKILVRAANIPPQERVAICLHYIPKDRRRRDPLNLVATLKAVEDGCVDAGLIPDDTPTFSEPTMPIIDEPNTGKGLMRRLYITITPVEPIHAVLL